MSRKADIERLERYVVDAHRAMTEQERIWMQEWKAAPNPFVAIQEWNKNHERRMVHIQPWLDAKHNLAKLKGKK
jgi:hypothetical protein